MLAQHWGKSWGNKKCKTHDMLGIWSVKLEKIFTQLGRVFMSFFPFM